MSSLDFFMRLTVCLRSAFSKDAGLMSLWTLWLTLHRLSWRLIILSSNWVRHLRFHGSFDRQIAHRFSWLWRMIPRQIWRRRLEEHANKLNLKNDQYQLINQCKDFLGRCVWILFILFIWLLPTLSVRYSWIWSSVWVFHLTWSLPLRSNFASSLGCRCFSQGFTGEPGESSWGTGSRLMDWRQCLCELRIAIAALPLSIQAQTWKTVRCGRYLEDRQGWSWITIFDGIQVFKRKQWKDKSFWRTKDIQGMLRTEDKMVSLGFSEKTSDNSFVFRHTRGVIPVHNMCIAHHTTGIACAMNASMPRV